MAEDKSFGEHLRQLDADTLVNTFNGLLGRSEDEGDRAAIMARFEDDYPGLSDFITRLNEAEDQGLFDDSNAPAEAKEGDFGPNTYGALLGFLTLIELSKTEDLSKLFKV